MSQGQPPQYPPQYPPSSPPPPQQPPPGYPPGNYPPSPGMGGYPPGANYAPQGTPMGTPKTSVAAVFSLVFGILLCIPGAGLLAAVLGIVGISATSNNKRGGRGLAIAGLLLGLLGVLGWGTIGSVFYTGWRHATETKPVRDQFITALANGQVDAAHAMCTPAVSREELQGIADQLKPAGALRDITGLGFKANWNNGASATQVVAVATFAKGQHQFLLVMDQVSGQWKVKEVKLDPKQGTATTSGSP